jgi:putative ABC transport system substrate-binding protein
LEHAPRDPDHATVLADLHPELHRLPLGIPAGVLGGNDCWETVPFLVSCSKVRVGDERARRGGQEMKSAQPLRRRGERIRRRELLLLLLGGAITAPRLVCAQQKAMLLIGYINGAAMTDSADLVAAFKRGLGEAGYFEGQSIALDYRSAEGHYDRLTALAEDLVYRQVAVIVATSTPVALAAKAATSTIPVVFSIGGDPVKLGLVAGLSRPGGNITGVTRFNVELGPKRLELLHDTVPSVKKVALLVNPSNPNTETLSQSLQATSHALGLDLEVLYASTEAEFDAVFESIVQKRIGALLIGNDPFFNGRSEQLAALTVLHSVPAIYQYRQFVEAGGLLSYGASNTDSHRQLGAYVGRILAGAQPADLPVEQSTKVELIINLKAAAALGLTISQVVLGRADEVIE